MKKIILSFFIISLFKIHFAASQQLIISPESHDDFSLGYSKVLGYDDNGFFVLTSNLSLQIVADRVGFRNRKYKLAYFNKNLNRIWEKNIIANIEDASLDAISFFNEEVMVVSSMHNKTKNVTEYYVSFIDKSGEQNNIQKPITDFNTSTNDYEKCKVIVSASKDKFSIITREFTESKNQHVFTGVFDNLLNEINKQSVVIPYPDKTFELVGYSLSNKGDLVLMGTNSEKIKTFSSKRKVEYFAYSSPHDKSGFKEFNISGDKNITGLGIAFDNVNNQVVFAGFYSEIESFVGAGIYYGSIKIDSTNELSIKTKGIDSQKNIKLLGTRNSGSGMGLVSYPIERIVLRQDGGAVIVAEAAYTTEFSYYDSFSQSFTRRLEYHFDNIIIISINNEGVADWSSIVEKQQVSLDDGGVFSSFCSLLNSEQLVILYNDNIGRRNKIIPVSINNLGNTVRMKSVQQTEGLQLIPRSGKQISENEIIVPGIVKRRLHFVKFTF